jgi:transcriptional regulator with XRE-family HTH domain
MFFFNFFLQLDYFSLNIKHLRLKKKLTFDQLAELSGIPKATLNHYELRKREPSMEAVLKICTFFDVDLYQFIHEDLSQPGVKIKSLFATEEAKQASQSKVSKQKLQDDLRGADPDLLKAVDQFIENTDIDFLHLQMAQQVKRLQHRIKQLEPPIEEAERLPNFDVTNKLPTIEIGSEEKGHLKKVTFSEKRSPNPANEGFSYLALQPVAAGSSIVGQLGWSGSGVVPVYAPGLPKNSLIVPVEGDSMSPLIAHKDYVVAHRIQDVSDVLYNRVYIVITSEPAFYIKRVQLSSDGLVLISEDSTKEAPKSFGLGMIVEIYLVSHIISSRSLGYIVPLEPIE